MFKTLFVTVLFVSGCSSTTSVQENNILDQGAGGVFDNTFAAGMGGQDQSAGEANVNIVSYAGKSSGSSTFNPVSEKMHILFLGGQSNVIAQLGTEPHKDFPNDKIPMISRVLGPDLFTYDTGSVPVSLDLINGFHSIELTAATTMYNAGLPTAVVKIARGGSWLGQWRLNSRNPPGYWQALVEQHDRASELWPNAIWHFVWLQSESDSMQAAYADLYEENLRAFVNEVRTVFGPIYFYQCKLQPFLAKTAAGKIVRDAQIKIMSESPLNKLIDFDDLNGSLHYSSAQLDIMGVRIDNFILNEKQL